MNIKVVAVGKIREKWLKDGIEEYKKRISKYANIEIIEVSDSSDSIPIKTALNTEGERIISKIKNDKYVVALDLHGEMYDSVSFSKELKKMIEKGGSSITFVIGGSNGFSEAVLNCAKERICISKMTFTHQMTRLILLEQCFRAFKIENGEKYHK